MRTTQEVEKEIQELELLLAEQESGSAEYQELTEWLLSLKKLCVLMQWRDHGIATGRLKSRPEKNGGKRWNSQ